MLKEIKFVIHRRSRNYWKLHFEIYYGQKKINLNLKLEIWENSSKNQSSAQHSLFRMSECFLTQPRWHHSWLATALIKFKTKILLKHFQLTCIVSRVLAWLIVNRHWSSMPFAIHSASQQIMKDIFSLLTLLPLIKRSQIINEAFRMF